MLASIVLSWSLLTRLLDHYQSFKKRNIFHENKPQHDFLIDICGVSSRITSDSSSFQSFMAKIIQYFSSDSLNNTFISFLAKAFSGLILFNTEFIWI